MNSFPPPSSPPAVPPPPQKPETTLRSVSAVRRFLLLPHSQVFLRSFGVLMLLAATSALLSIKGAEAELEAKGNQFADLVWMALPTRLINDGILTALVAGLITLAGSVVKRRMHPSS